MTESAPEQKAGAAPEAKKKEKKKRLRGFANIIESQLAPLNTSDYFKQTYGQDNYNMLIVDNTDKYAALVHIKDGAVDTEQVNREDEAEFKAAKKRSNGRIITDFETLIGIISGKVDPVKALFKRKLKIGGIKKVLRFVKYFKIISYIQKQQKIAAKQKAEAQTDQQPTSP